LLSFGFSFVRLLLETAEGIPICSLSNSNGEDSEEDRGDERLFVSDWTVHEHVFSCSREVVSQSDVE
jgi:hypothetical protein